MLTQKCRRFTITGQVEEARLTQTSMVGGSTESDKAEVAVSPTRSSPLPAVTTTTPPTRRRIACFSRPASATGGGGASGVRLMSVACGGSSRRSVARELRYAAMASTIRKSGDFVRDPTG